MGHIFCTVQAVLAGIAAGEGCPDVCQARHVLFPCGEQTEQVDPRLHPSTLQRSLTLAISQCARINLR